MEKGNKLRYQRKALTRWRRNFQKRTYRRTITKNLAICSGYSRLLESMSNHVGIQCVTIEGYGRVPTDRIGSGSINHAWNAVRLNNQWYLVDATWASGGVNFRSNYIKRFNNNYFLTDPYYFATSHYPKNRSWLLLYNKPALKDFLNEPIKTADFITNKINHFHPIKGVINAHLDSLTEFRFSSNKLDGIKFIDIEIWNNDYFNQHEFPIQKNESGEYYFLHKFSKRGYFRVSINIDGRSTIIYEVKVS